MLLNGTQNNKFVWTFTIYNGSEKTTLNQNSLKTRVKFTEKEWEAVNHNAVSPSFLTQLLDNADSDNYTQLAMPKTDTIGTAKRNRVKALYNAGWTQEEIAKAVGISQSSISSILK